MADVRFRVEQHCVVGALVADQIPVIAFAKTALLHVIVVLTNTQESPSKSAVFVFRGLRVSTPECFQCLDIGVAPVPFPVIDVETDNSKTVGLTVDGNDVQHFVPGCLVVVRQTKFPQNVHDFVFFAFDAAGA